MVYDHMGVTVYAIQKCDSESSDKCLALFLNYSYISEILSLNSLINFILIKREYIANSVSFVCC